MAARVASLIHMVTNATTVGVLIGIVVGFPGGALYAVARRSWTDLAGAKKAVPVARKSALSRTREALLLGVALAIVGGVALAIARDR